MNREEVKQQCRDWYATFEKLYGLYASMVMTKDGKRKDNGYFLAIDAFTFIDNNGPGKGIKLSLFNDDITTQGTILAVYEENDDVFKCLYGKIISLYLMKNYPTDSRIAMDCKTVSWSLAHEMENKRKASPVVLRLFNVTRDYPEYKRIFMSEVGCHNSGTHFPVWGMINDLLGEIRSEIIIDDSINKSIENMETLIENFENIKGNKKAM